LSTAISHSPNSLKTILRTRVAASNVNATWEADQLGNAKDHNYADDCFKVSWKYAKLRSRIPEFDAAVSTVIVPVRAKYSEDQTKAAAAMCEVKEKERKVMEEALAAWIERRKCVGLVPASRLCQ
jgi:hypothetical protein